MKKIILSQIPIEELIEKIAVAILKNKTESQKQEQKKFLSLEELSKGYGFAKPTIYALTSKREIPFIKKGKRLLFERSEIESWILEGRKKTKAEIKKEFDNDLNKKLGGENYDK